ncbi:2-nitropropane dioxygenase NPD [Mesorhizobium sp. SOD10]|nr:2-nitropropane dioxygenase NPD [Mesorhizobium sp. SOD10]
MQPGEIGSWVSTFRSMTDGPFQLNLWVPDPAPARDAKREEEVREFLAQWGPDVPAAAGDAVPPDFEAQCDALIVARPPIVSSVMGLFPRVYVERLRQHGISWFAVVSTLSEALEAEAAGADAIVVQGMEAGGHRAAFNPEKAERELVGLFALLPIVVDAVHVPVIATGGVADARGIVAALALGASAVQIGTGYLRCPEAEIHPAWADAIGQSAPEGTLVSRVFSGRPGRSIATRYVIAATGPDAPPPAPYPVQRGLTAPMRREANRDTSVDRLQAWAGQAGRLSRSDPAGEFTRRLWAEAQAMLAA